MGLISTYGYLWHLWRQVESQQALQKKIFQERCVELQAKLDKSRGAYYEKGRELEVTRSGGWADGLMDPIPLCS